MATKRRQKSPGKAPSAPPEEPEKRKPSAKSPPPKPRTPPIRKISINGKEREFLLKSEVVELLGNWPKVVDRMLHATRDGVPWLEIVSNRSGTSGAEVRVTAESVSRAVERLRRGEVPPLMPSEKKAACPSPATKATGKIPDKTMSALLRAGDLLPPGITSATFNQQMKFVVLQWENGIYQFIRRITKPGRNTRVSTVSFDCTPDKPSPIRPSRKGEQDD
jgi:hypothetical protein